MHTNGSSIYRRKVFELLHNIEEKEIDNIKNAAEIIVDVLNNDGVLHVFSSGHSHIVIEEMFYRAGGLVPVNPIFDTGLMLHEGARKSSKIERLSGYAEIILANHDTREGEPMIIVSSSGINPVIVEMAMLARKKGLKVIAVTSRNITGKLQSRHKSGKKLIDLADIVIDNCIRDNDAAVPLDDTGQRVGPLSSLASLFIVNSIIVETSFMIKAKGKTPLVFKSANMPGGDEHNQKLIDKYKDRIKGL
jgi:uncharacterized phosphosugar-binding protein